jgi:alpha-ketoglutarate-dependent taurine dioxygenase
VTNPSPIGGLRMRLQDSHSRMPLVLEPSTIEKDLAALLTGQQAALQAALLEHGALLFRGFRVEDVSDFERFVSITGWRHLDYTYRSTPRKSVTARVYTATEYPPELEIPLHNENSYQHEWPNKLAFCCLQPAASGGETPLADMRRVNAALGEPLLEQFERRGVQYIRHYRPYFDLDWQTVFQTEDPRELSRFCDTHGIIHEWLEDRTLRTIQTSQGVARHPVLRERTFFNQAHLFHVSSLGEEGANALIELFGRDRLPRHACFGDGGEIPLAELATIRQAFAAAAIAFNWEMGDILLIDNMQAAHGRRPYRGARSVVAALLDPSHS